MSKEVVAEVIALIELGMIAPEDIVKCLRKANSEPPQRTWVGLTDVLDFIEEFTGAERERHPMFSDGYDLALSHVKELVEAKIKEKNSA